MERVFPIVAPHYPQDNNFNKPDSELYQEVTM
jgi:hypothetical protein